ncbi:MAG: DUF2589 domain-containing protein [Magnetospirillum sp.]|nr:DUF2589 domain-containing protein [Magnetospirillum sp.]
MASLHDLIHAIAGAVAEAQEKIQRFQISTVRGYFDEYNRPVSVDIRLPSLSQGADADEERVVHVPLLSLAGPHLLAIKDVDVEFEIGLGGLTDAEAPPAAGAESGQGTASGDSHKVLGVDLNASPNRDGGPKARVTLKVEGREPSEGMARLIQQLDKLI